MPVSFTVREGDLDGREVMVSFVVPYHWQLFYWSAAADVPDFGITRVYLRKGNLGTALTPRVFGTRSRW